MDKDRTVQATVRGREDFVTASGEARLSLSRVQPDMDVYIRDVTHILHLTQIK